MATRLQRHLGKLADIEPRQWASDPPRVRVGLVFVACPKCGGVDEIAKSRIARDGGVVPAWQCPGATCSFKDFVTLEGWGFDVSDVGAKA